MKNIKKWLSGALAILMLVTSIPINALETNNDETVSNNSVIEDIDDNDEVSVDNWNISLSFYDSTIGNGKTKLDSYVYDATDVSSSRQIILQISYKNDNTVTSYAPGELTIRIPKFTNYKVNIPNTVENQKYVSYTTATIGDDPENYNWKLKQNGTDYYLFTNNIAIEEKTNFEGTIQLCYTPSTISLVNGYTFDFQAILADSNGTLATSNIAPFSFTSTRKNQQMNMSAKKLEAYDGLPEGADDYIWVQWNISLPTTDDGTRYYHIPYLNGQRTLTGNDEIDNSFYWLDYLPEECIAMDSNLNILENNNGTVIWKTQNVDSGGQRYAHSMATTLIVGYPKSTYENQKIENVAAAYGIFYDEDEIDLIATKTVGINAADFDFGMPGDGGGFYSFNKYTGSNGIVSADWARFKYSAISYSMFFKYLYPGYPCDLVFSDDYLVGPNDNNDYEFLSDNDYYFSDVKWRAHQAVNAYGASLQDHEMELWVRYKNTDEYVLYDTTIFNNQDVNYYFPEGEVVGWKIIFKDMDESIKNLWSYPITTTLHITKKDIADTGTLYNFAYMDVLVNGENIAQTAEEWYKTQMTKDFAMNYDLEHYGEYKYRFAGSSTITTSRLGFRLLNYQSSAMAIMNNNAAEEKYEGRYQYRVTMQINHGTTDHFNGLILYDLLPEGMNFESLTTYNSFPNNDKQTPSISTQSGIQLTAAYINNHIVVKEIQNWNDTNRTLITITYDFSDDPLDLTTAQIRDSSGILSDMTFPFFDINVSVPHDSYFEHGTTWENTLYMDVIDRYEGEFFTANHYLDLIDNTDKTNIDGVAKDEIDINSNGENENLFKSTLTISIIDLVEAYQDVQAQVKSTISNYSTGYVDAECDNVYTYKLRVRTGISDATNLVIYDNLEEAYRKNKYWQGELLSIDTSFIEKQGYVVKTYYSENKTTGTLAEDDSWTEYTEDTDINLIESLAFEILDSEGNPAVIPSGSLLYVLINMKAPADESLTTLAFNQCWTRWNSIDEYGRVVDDITGINSNIVKVALPNSIKKEALNNIKIKFTKEIIGTDEAFENMNLDQSASYDFTISLVNTETGVIYHGILNSKGELTFSEMQDGTYIVSEADDNYFDFVDMVENNYIDGEILAVEGITFQKQDDKYVLVISEETPDDMMFNIKVINTIEDNHYYEEKEEKSNLFLINKN